MNNKYSRVRKKHPLLYYIYMNKYTYIFLTEKLLQIIKMINYRFKLLYKTIFHLKSYFYSINFNAKKKKKRQH